jgi:hypothetical protein
MERSNEPPRIDVQHDGQTITIIVRTVPSTQPAVDELVRIAPAPLRALDLEYNAILKHAQSGDLRTAWIGRARYTRKSWLAALLEKLPPAADAHQPIDDIAVAARRIAERRVARAAGESR